MKKHLRKTSGITLIALVITIIVLLILAGIAINTIAGNNGVLTKATQAKSRTEEAEQVEKEKLQEFSELLDEYDNSVEKVIFKYDENLPSDIGEGITGGALPRRRVVRKRRHFES